MNVTTEIYEAVNAEYDAGMRVKKIAEKYGLSEACAYRILRAESAAAKGEYEALRRLDRTSATTVAIACAKYGISLHGADSPSAAPAVPAPVDNTATAAVRVLELLEELVQSNKDVGVALQGISTELSALRMVVAGTRKDMNERVDKVAEAVNINGDIITKEHDKMTDLLGAIKMNTKKLPQALRGSD